MVTYSYLQPSFATGVISEEVAARVDIEKYKAALLTAENVYIRPYGGLYKRPGSIFCGETKFSDKKVILRRFNYSDSASYMLEIGERYVRIWLDGVYTGIEVETDFLEGDLKYLRFTQSADVMYITSGRLPVKTLSRYSDIDWRFDNLKIDIESFMPINIDEDIKITPTEITGDITLIANKDVFSEDLIDSQIKISHKIGTAEVSAGLPGGGSGAPLSGAVLCGKSWSFITRGIWAGSVQIQKSKDGITWEIEQTFSAWNDFNVNVNGTVTEATFFRVFMSGSAGSNGANATLTSKAYTHDGIVKITGVTDGKNATAEVVKMLGSTAATDLWCYSAWSHKNGFPMCVSFYQDRLAFAGSKRQPNNVWFSRTGNYTSFEVEKADGKVLDDSGISLSIIARELFDIRHIVPTQDFALFTSGNEWILSGNNILKPTEVNPRVQTAWGSSYLEPLLIGNRIVYVQRRGGKVRDMGYTYESDNYTGDDLTLFVSHLTKGASLIDATYSQQPDSMIYFVRDDGAILCLTYLREQQVFAWSVIQTKGSYENVVSVPTDKSDDVYVVVKRVVDSKVVRYIERFAADVKSDYPSDHICMDAAKVIDNNENAVVIDGLEHLKGELVQIIGDDNLCVSEGYIVSDEGRVTLPYVCKKVVIGIPYKMKIELPDIASEVDGVGSTQGKKKTLNKAILKVENSFGGRAYVSDETDAKDIFTSDAGGRNILLPNLKLRLKTKCESVNPGQNTNDTAKLFIVHDEPYPFSLLSIVREVVI